MAFKKTIAQRLFSMTRITNPISRNRRITPPPITAAVKSAAPDPGDDGVFRRYLHRQAASATTPSGLRFLPAGEKLLEKLRGMDIAKDRIRFDGLKPPPVAEAEEESLEGKLTVADAKKVIRLSQLEMVKSRLRQVEKDCVPYSEFLEICGRECSNLDQGMEFAKILDQSGSVIVLGNIVFLRPEKVVQTIQGLIPAISPSPSDPRTKELREMEKMKAAIDRKAETYVRRELLCGLGFGAVQTAAFMRLTFWELSWDVMEPICFFVSSMYFVGGYAFFMRMGIEPTFEGFFKGRFGARQSRLMRDRGFDVVKYDELKRSCRL